MTPLARRVLWGLGVGAFYLACLALFVRLTFPYEMLKERLVSEFNQSQKDRHLEIQEMSGHFLSGVEAMGVKLTSTLPKAPGEEGGPPDSLIIDELTISVSPIGYLLGSLSVDYSAEVGGGEVVGVFRQSEEEASSQLSLEDVDISSLTILSGIIGLPMSGVLSGEVDLVLPERKIQKAEGKFDLAISALAVGDGKAKIRGTIALPKLNAGDLVLKGDVKAGQLEVTEFGAVGPDFELSSTGKIRLREPFDRSAADLDVGFKFKEAYRNKNDLTKGIFGSPDGKIPGLFDMDPQVRQAKGEDGSYHYRVSGMLVKPSFRPGGKGGKPAERK